MAAKHTRSERPPSSSSSEEEDPHTKRIDGCPILIGKNVDLASFTFDAPSFNIENLFVGMGWVPIFTLNDKVYPTIVKDFYTKMNFSPGSGITRLFRNKHIKITHELIRTILHLEDGGVRLYTTKTIPHTDDYDPVDACCHVTGKHFEAVVRLSSNQFTLPCRILHNIIAHIIVPRKVAVLPKATDTINILTLKRMKIFKENEQWVAKSKGFDDESGPSTLPFEGEDMDEDAPPPSPPRPRSHRPSSSTSGFNEDHFNLLNGRIDSLTSTVDGLQHTANIIQTSVGGLQSSVDGLSSLHHTAEELRLTMGTLQQSVDGMTSLLRALHSRLDAMVPPPPPSPET
ncbi:Uncharacterized protein Adt_30366 [Abeliophyllum distichum]|uniref:Uncharacterized protein n=1 Tax=Abeliophyllum distichum TaxID=126358 RepID=A0ABD1RB24_9LAMI